MFHRISVTAITICSCTNSAKLQPVLIPSEQEYPTYKYLYFCKWIVSCMCVKKGQPGMRFIIFTIGLPKVLSTDTALSNRYHLTAFVMVFGNCVYDNSV